MYLDFSSNLLLFLLISLCIDTSTPCLDRLSLALFWIHIMFPSYSVQLNSTAIFYPILKEKGKKEKKMKKNERKKKNWEQ